MKERTKNQKGITLIALIITIVVLMILAAVAINSITNDGILSQAGSTANTYNQSVKNEQSYLKDYEDMLTAANGGYKDKNFEIGDEVSITVGSETHNFYVIEDKIALGKVVLVVKEAINTKTLKQENADKIAFSETNYWSTIEGITYPYDLTETGVPDESHYALRAAYDYGVKLGGTGRLLSRSYGPALDVLNNLHNFWPVGWAGAACDGTNVLCVDGTDTGWWTCPYYGLEAEDFDGNTFVDRCPLFPVVEISKSKVTKVQ